ncbi:DNA repair protein XRCC4 isoform X3 [Pygocentrus nattereri]|uniref:DNA repair protein XRCC4 isoform X3 n=1 Tax=Pygocentrus nattereri TaxID=42514 RepID=UPI001891144B|nr:DNA repair protein XRCC4 isoform X3 [Pygocentrus nattereri]
MKVTVRQISVVSKPECTFYLKLEWAKDMGAGFVVLLCDGISAWSGEVSEDDVTREAQEMEMAREKYVYDLQLALTGEGQEAQSYSFHLAPEKAGGPMLQLSYEKVQSDISFRLGMVELLPVPESTEVIRELISHGLDRSACFRARNHHLLEENQRLRSEQEHMTAERKREASGNGEICLTDHKPEEESDYGSTTEEEREEDAKAPPLRPSNQVFISNPMDDSLNDTTDVAPSRKRRQRHLQQLESQNKRPALEQRQSSRNELPEEAKAEVQKTPVQDGPDPDDLFDDI